MVYQKHGRNEELPEKVGRIIAVDRECVMAMRKNGNALERFFPKLAAKSIQPVRGIVPG